MLGIRSLAYGSVLLESPLKALGLWLSFLVQVKQKSQNMVLSCYSPEEDWWGYMVRPEAACEWLFSPLYHGCTIAAPPWGPATRLLLVPPSCTITAEMKNAQFLLWGLILLHIYSDCRVTLHRSGIFRVCTFGDTFLTLIAGLLRTCGPFPYVITIAHRQVGTQLLPIIIIISSITIIIITITINTTFSRNNNMDFFKYSSVISDFNK